MKLLIFITLLICSPVAHAIDEPLRAPSKLARPQVEEMVRVKGAKILLLDYELLKKDFPELAGATNEVIDEWVLSKTAYVSSPQARQVKVNTPIELTGEKVRAFRPKDYGRAVVFQAGSGLIDAKGAGGLRPGLGDHSNGLASLGETVREYLYERLVNKIFQHNGEGFETVRNYGVVDLGFDIKGEDGKVARAGMVLRQAHVRSGGSYSLLSDEAALKIEKSIRPYGLTSAGAHRNRYRHELLNIQGTSSGAVVDFGGFLTVEHFQKPLYSFFKAPWSKALLTVKEAMALQPDKKLQLPDSLWGTSVTKKLDPAFDNPWIWSHELAEAVRTGKADRAAAEQHVRNFLEPVEKQLAANAPHAPMPPVEVTCDTFFGRLFSRK